MRGRATSWAGGLFLLGLALGGVPSAIAEEKVPPEPTSAMRAYQAYDLGYDLANVIVQMDEDADEGAFLGPMLALEMKARAFGVEGYNLAEAEDPVAMLAKAIETPGPCIVDAPIREVENVYPMVPSGAGTR